MKTIRASWTLVGLLLATKIVSADILVASANAHSIFKFDQVTGAFLSQFDLTLFSNQAQGYPNGLMLAPDGYAYTATTDSSEAGFTSQIQRFDPASGKLLASFGALPQTRGMTIGPDGLIYVSAFNVDQVWRYDPNTGAFVDIFISNVIAGGCTFCGVGPEHMVFGPDGNLYVSVPGADSVVKFNGKTGALISQFINEPGLSPGAIIFGPDGNLYVGSSVLYPNQVRRYNGATGAFDKVFAANANLSIASSLAFGPDSKLYVGSSLTASVLRFDGTTGAFLDVFILPGAGGMGTNLTAILFTGVPNPVILIHGYCSDPTAFGNMRKLLTDQGLHVYPFDYSGLTKIGGGRPGSCSYTSGTDYTIEQIAACFGGFAQDVRSQESGSQVDVIAHSEGGLITRAWMAGMSKGPTYARDIARLATVGTPHYGQPIDATGNNARQILEGIITLGNGDTCSELQVTEQSYGSDFISRLHESWTTFQESSAALSHNNLLFVAGTHADACNGLPNSLFRVDSTPCNDGLVDVDSAVLPAVAPSTSAGGFIRYVPYQHCDSCGIGTAEIKINDASHKTYKAINQWLSTGIPPNQCCGADTIDYSPSFFTDTNGGFLLLRARDAEGKRKAPQLQSITFSPQPSSKPKAFFHQSALTNEEVITITQLPAPNTYDISLKFNGYEPVKLHLLIPKDLPTVPAVLLLRHK